eukprot:CAMPEP_0202449838 /NCGR_PEP_ID=MMETSP1360-20130828/8532_1 /ASSEMBLY_ACC=CAM_ASM_000848 /TAXON_ID=515479 /ORGANISM="Licmophora paradoxa, Strain CCMP2313" /LENGTH=813 /DNA_ID=CAMNT_0049067897 /DNA_START=49 /DNA_END=2490 /DNA_ORIENTATION=-
MTVDAKEVNKSVLLRRQASSGLSSLNCNEIFETNKKDDATNAKKNYELADLRNSVFHESFNSFEIPRFSTSTSTQSVRSGAGCNCNCDCNCVSDSVCDCIVDDDGDHDDCDDCDIDINNDGEFFNQSPFNHPSLTALDTDTDTGTDTGTGTDNQEQQIDNESQKTTLTDLHQINQDRFSSHIRAYQSGPRSKSLDIYDLEDLSTPANNFSSASTSTSIGAHTASSRGEKQRPNTVPGIGAISAYGRAFGERPVWASEHARTRSRSTITSYTTAQSYMHQSSSHSYHSTEFELDPLDQSRTYSETQLQQQHEQDHENRCRAYILAEEASTTIDFDGQTAKTNMLIRSLWGFLLLIGVAIAVMIAVGITRMNMVSAPQADSCQETQDFNEYNKCKCRSASRVSSFVLHTNYNLLRNLVLSRLRASHNSSLLQISPLAWYTQNEVNKSDCNDIRNMAMWNLVSTNTTDLQGYAMHVLGNELGVDYRNGWGDQSDICSWSGVICDSGNVVRQISLSFTGTTGTLPPEIGLLQQIELLQLSSVGVSGTIPTEIGLMTSLTALRIETNFVHGTLPSEIGNLMSLSHLQLSFNKLTGPIPLDIGRLKNLVSLKVIDNAFTGNIPIQISNLTNLEILELHNNILTGYIPSVLGSLNSLAQFSFGGNEFNDQPIPPFIWTLSNLKGLHFDSLLFTGTLPNSGLANLTQLEVISFEKNAINGTLSSEVGLLTKLREFSALINDLSGTLPSELGLLTKLTGLKIGQNKWGGSIPSELGNLTQLRTLDFSDTGLTGSLDHLCRRISRKEIEYFANYAVQCSCCLV